MRLILIAAARAPPHVLLYVFSKYVKGALRLAETIFLIPQLKKNS
jgi:hypothetical protein